MKKKIQKDIYGGKILGNKTTVNPREKVQSEYETYAITQIEQIVNGVPMVSEENVRQCKHFVDENKK